MELSPKQQSVELIKKANRLLIIGSKTPDGDFLGSALSFQKALLDMKKSADVAVTTELPDIYKFLPFVDKIQANFAQESGKIIRINTKKVPVKSVKFQKDEEHLDFILEADKNLKFEYIEIINGEPKPDLIIVLNTPDVEKIDTIYDKNTELFFEVPVINIDHHAGNEYFGTVNLVDLTATSTAEILVSLLEALGVKISDADSATLLLCGIISETQSFRSGSTTPKSLTVAAQLLAAGGRQQEIVNNLYRRRPMALMKIWGEMIADLKLDTNHKFAWTKVKLANDTPVTVDDVMDSADELLSNNPDVEIVLILSQKGTGNVCGKFKGRKGSDVLELARLFEGDGVPNNATFELSDMKLGDSELMVLKTLADFWGEQSPENGDLWNVVEKSGEKELIKEMTAIPPLTEDQKTEKEIEKEMVAAPELTDEEKEKIVSEIEKEMTESPAKDDRGDVIDTALNSIEKEEKKATKKGTGSFASIGEVLYKRGDIKKHERKRLEEIDVFDEDE